MDILASINPCNNGLFGLVGDIHVGNVLYTLLQDESQCNLGKQCVHIRGPKQSTTTYNICTSCSLLIRSMDVGILSSWQGTIDPSHCCPSRSADHHQLRDVTCQSF